MDQNKDIFNEPDMPPRYVAEWLSDVWARFLGVKIGEFITHNGGGLLVLRFDQQQPGARFNERVVPFIFVPSSVLQSSTEWPDDLSAEDIETLLAECDSFDKTPVFAMLPGGSSSAFLWCPQPPQAARALYQAAITAGRCPAKQLPFIGMG